MVYGKQQLKLNGLKILSDFNIFFYVIKSEKMAKILDKTTDVCYNKRGYHICLGIGSVVSTPLP